MHNRKIIIDIRMLKYSGIGTYVDNLVYRVINSLEDYQFILLLNNTSDYTEFFKKIKHNNYKIIKINSDIYSISEQIEIWYKIPKKHLVFWSPHYNIPILIRSKILVTIHDIYHRVDSSRSNFIKKAYSFIMLNIIKFKKCNIITVSNFTKNEILNHTSINKSQIDVIYNGLEDIWNSYSTYINSNNILYVGNMKKHKNVSLLIEAFNNISKSYNIKLYLVGKMSNDLDRKFIRMIDNNKNIFLVEYVDKNKLINYYNNAKLFVFPSTYEGFGFTPLEAMACGCPVLASKVASIPEICSNGAVYFENNNLKDLTNKMLRLIENKNITDELIEKGYSVSRKYLWKNTAIKTIKNLKNLLSL